MSNTVKWNFCR